MWAFLVFYIISFCIAYREVRFLFSKGGQFECLRVGGVELICVSFPIFNTVFGISYWIERKIKMGNVMEKFFRIKRSE